MTRQELLTHWSDNERYEVEYTLELEGISHTKTELFSEEERALRFAAGMASTSCCTEVKVSRVRDFIIWHTENEIVEESEEKEG